MKNLARHIDYLLHDNDCVILPGFGGFIANVVPAYYVSEEHLYYPPTRSISFNAALTMNDGLLIQSYMHQYKVDYAKASQLVDAALDELNEVLDEEGTATLPNIGTFHKDIHQSILFVPENTGIAAPEFFGLGAFRIHQLSYLEEKVQKKAEVKAEASVTPRAVITQTDKTIDVHIRKGLIRQIVSTAAIVILLLSFAMPLGDAQPVDVASILFATSNAPVVVDEKVSEDSVMETTMTPAVTVVDTLVNAPAETLSAAPLVKEEVSMTVAQPTVVAPTITEQASVEAEPTTTIAEPIAPTVEPVTTKATLPVAKPAEKPAPAVNRTPSKVYHVIIASLPAGRDTKEVVEKYTRKGFQHITVVNRDNRSRISLAQFTDKSEANAFLKDLRNDGEFKSAWLLAVRQ